jgi:hypothetical protein
VKAEDYVSPDHFVSQVYDEKTGTYHAATAADIQKSTDWDVTKEQTVQGQMETLTKDLANNPVYQSIADAMRRSAAAAGGGNSLMAESAAYDKVIGLAFNIATSDAATYAKSAEFNASMKNQFSLANNNFVYQALLSDQNYAQSQVLQSEQIKGNIDSVDRQIAGQLESTKIAGKAQVMAAQAQAGGMVASANIQADASTKNAALAAKTQLQMGELERRNMLDAAEISHEGRMQELQYGAESDLGKMAFGATIDKDAYQYKADDTFVKQTLLFDRQDTSTDLTNMASRLHDAQMQPGITPAQLARYTQDEVSNYTTNTALKTAKTLSIIDSMKSASGAGSGSDAVTPDNPYGKWSNYLNYKAPTPGPLPFYEGHTPGTAYAPAIPDLDKPFVPGLPVPG